MRKCACHGRIGLAEVIEDCFHGVVQAVEIETVKPDLRLIGAVIPLPQPPDKIQDIAIPPHPLGKPFEPAECIRSHHVAIGASHKFIHSPRVGPIGLDGDAIETELLNQPSGDVCAGCIEFVRAVCGFAEHDNLRFFAALDQSIVV